MGCCDGRVVIVTGAGRGLGRAHALTFASEGAHVLVNDLGATSDGSQPGSDDAATAVVDEILAAGGSAAVNHSDVADWDQAAALVAQAIDTWGRLDTLVCNAGFLRDRMLVNMSEQEWDAVVRVHLKGHFSTGPPRGRLLAGAPEGLRRRAPDRPDRQHLVRGGPDGIHRPGQLCSG